MPSSTWARLCPSNHPFGVIGSLLAILTGIVFIGTNAQLRPSHAAEGFVGAIDPAQIQQLEVEPGYVILDGPLDKQRLLASAQLIDARGARWCDVTQQVQWSLQTAGVALLNSRWELEPLSEGETVLVGTLGEFTCHVPIRCQALAEPPLVDLKQEVVPILTKLGCNGGGCHGKSGGQNGFRLSLLGFEPERDYEYLAWEAGTRRLFPAMPDHSLLLRKATGELPHGGGSRMSIGDENYQVLVHWIRQGMPASAERTGTLERVELSPKQRVLLPGQTQRLRVTAHYTDGRQEDVTRFAVFASNNEEVALVEEEGIIRTRSLFGEAALMARYQDEVDVATVVVPAGPDRSKEWTFQPVNFIDEWTAQKWQQLGIMPSAPADDHTFLRRVTLDLCGRLPTLAEIQQFLSMDEPKKRELWINQLLDSPDYAANMAMKWNAILQNRRQGQPEFAHGSHAMALWLRDAFASDKPFDELVHDILTATGTPEINPPVTWFRSVRTPEENVDNMSQLFLGTRIQCARCHHHPQEKWSQADYQDFAAFFSRIGRKETDQPLGDRQVRASESIYVRFDAEPVQARGLGGPMLTVFPGDDPRQLLAEWMTASDNPFFARALVNRMWGHFFGRGIVEPIDDLRVTNPPTNPELLEALAREFIQHNYSLKALVRAICLSATYQLSSVPNETNASEKQSFARYYPKRLSAEVILDAVDQVTGVKTDFGLPANYSAVDLPDEGYASYFLDVFGRPARASSCECERVNEVNLSGTLHLLNSKEVQAKLSAPNGRAFQLAEDSRDQTTKIDELFLTVFSRPPTLAESEIVVDYLAQTPNKVEGYQNLIWALINSKEFLFNI